MPRGSKEGSCINCIFIFRFVYFVRIKYCKIVVIKYEFLRDDKIVNYNFTNLTYKRKK